MLVIDGDRAGRKSLERDVRDFAARGPGGGGTDGQGGQRQGERQGAGQVAGAGQQRAARGARAGGVRDGGGHGVLLVRSAAGPGCGPPPRGDGPSVGPPPRRAASAPRHLCARRGTARGGGVRRSARSSSWWL